MSFQTTVYIQSKIVIKIAQAQFIIEIVQELTDRLYLICKQRNCFIEQ